LAGLQQRLAEAMAELERQRHKAAGWQRQQQHLTAELHTLRTQVKVVREALERKGNTVFAEVVAVAQQHDSALRDAEEARAQLELVAEVQAAGQRALLEAQREARESREEREELRRL
ncbi:CROCC protein, partial [Alectura lathami]|nr:CROCC protein [Alectura lathami]